MNTDAGAGQDEQTQAKRTPTPYSLRICRLRCWTIFFYLVFSEEDQLQVESAWRSEPARWPARHHISARSRVWQPRHLRRLTEVAGDSRGL